MGDGAFAAGGVNPGTANPLWELSSPSEAAKAAVLLVEMLPELPLSRASPLPQVIGGCWAVSVWLEIAQALPIPVGVVEL